uniref:Uncharacterized protein n=1 Tax=Heterorhabditis bacteriophora TaxID=37862 RepID=A0A1I7WV30_HETBA
MPQRKRLAVDAGCMMGLSTGLPSGLIVGQPSQGPSPPIDYEHTCKRGKQQ